MNGFIAQVAAGLYDRYGDEISSLYLILPSRRAELFLSDALAGICHKPLWQPATLSIDELMAEISGQRTADRVRLVTELYKVWSRHHDEAFDEFYFWGEMLLADFDAVDKYLLDAEVVFSNVRDLKALEADHSYLSDEQRVVVQRFWSAFAMKEGFSEEQQAFLKVWDTLGTVYREYTEALAAQGLAYTGMQHRTAAEVIRRGEVPEGIAARHYAVIGFNALSECEKRLFDYLRDAAGAEFHWDYDHYYLDNPAHEAGHFMRSNITRYPAVYPLSGGYDSFRREKQIVAVSAPSDTLQCKYVWQFLESIREPGKETAVVLADEGLLEPLLYSMPDSVAQINITMGYPLRQTLVYSFAERLLELQRNKKRDEGGVRFYHADAVGLLRHPFVLETADTTQTVRHITDTRQIYPTAATVSIGELASAIFTAREGWRQTSDYLIDILSRVARNPQAANDPLRVEFLTVTVDGIRKLCNSLADCGVELSERVFASLLRRQLQGVRIPYEGEPLQGVQVMGFLETRTLDFENVVILSTGDDRLPGNLSPSASFIPYNLRAAYGLPTPAHHEAMYAYYFYRLLQRARRVHLVYCSRSDERRKGEPSRYIYQLEYESGHEVRRREVAIDANLTSSRPITVAKEGETLARLERFLATDGRKLSPTAFFAYVICPLRFYFRSVAGLEVREQVTEELDARLLGNILHRSMELLYAPLVGSAAPQEGVRALIGSEKVAQAVHRAIGEQFAADAVDTFGGLDFAREVVHGYIDRNILPYDAGQQGLRFEAFEQPLGCGFEFGAPGARRTVRFYGKADRIDRTADGLLRVVDYKTADRNNPGGSLVMQLSDVESLMHGEGRAAGAAAVQTLLYAMMLHREKSVDAQPAIYAVRHLREPDYSPLLLDKSTGCFVERYSDYAEPFEAQLDTVLTELFDPAVPFTQCEDSKQCAYCDFKTVCARKD